MRDLGGAPLFALALGASLRVKNALWWALGWGAWEALAYLPLAQYGWLGGATVAAVFGLTFLSAYWPMREKSVVARALALGLTEWAKLLLGIPLGLVTPGAAGTLLALLGRGLGEPIVTFAVLLTSATSLVRPPYSLLLLALFLPLPGKSKGTLEALAIQGGLTPQQKAALTDPRQHYSNLTPINLAQNRLVIWPETSTTEPPTSFPLWLGGVAEEGENKVFLVSQGSIQSRGKAIGIPGVEQLPRFLETFRNRVYALNGIPLPENFEPIGGRLEPLGIYGALICYEASVPWASVKLARKGARILVEVSNEGMFDEGVGRGIMTARRQKESQLRSATTGLWTLKVSENGPSHAVDPWGRLVKTTHKGKGAFVLPYDLEQPSPSVYWWPWSHALVFLGALSGLLYWKRYIGGSGCARKV